MARGAVVLIDADRVALIQRVRDGHTYYLFPGGKAEGAETTEQAAKRECLEELGVVAHIERLIATQSFNGRAQDYYLAHATAGTFGTGAGPELQNTPDDPDGTHTPVWIGLRDLPDLDVRPRALADALAKRRLPPAECVMTLE